MFMSGNLGRRPHPGCVGGHRTCDLLLGLSWAEQSALARCGFVDRQRGRLAATMFSSFMLPEPVAEEAFDANYYRKLLES